jgi:hypothetical protein
MWKLITEPKVIVQKICNECGKLIETFDATHPLTQYMIFDLRLNESSDLQVLDLGLQPYHWCPINTTGKREKDNNCLVPLKTTQREQEEAQLEKMRRKAIGLPVKSDPEHAPYKDPKFKRINTGSSRGRPSKLQKKLEEEKKENGN